MIFRTAYEGLNEASYGPLHENGHNVIQLVDVSM